MENTYWRKCGSCRKEIGFNTIYQVCSVSSCSKLVFCSVNCWDQHNPIMNHKAAWAEENRSPRKENAVAEPAEGVRRVIISQKNVSEEKKISSENDQEILIVVSKLKQYIKDKFEMNTAASVMDVLSQEVRKMTDRAAENARREGRKTLMDRDFH
jgi:histone H3/H4